MHAQNQGKLACVCLHRFSSAFNVYRRVLAPGTVSLTGDRAQGDDSKHWAYSIFESTIIIDWENLNISHKNPIFCKQSKEEGKCQ